MKIISYSGLTIFIIGFVLFLSAFFAEDYQLTESHLSRYMSENQAAIITSNSKVLNQHYNSSLAFIRDLKTDLAVANEYAIRNYGFTEVDIKLLGESPYKKFSIDHAISQLADDTVSRFKKDKLSAYASWMNGRSYQDKNSFNNHLEQVTSDINQYEVIRTYGFDEYTQKDLLFSLTKAASQGPVSSQSSLFLLLTYGLCILGAVSYLLPKLEKPTGIKNNGIFFSSMKNRGWLGWMTGTFLILFYIVLYFFPEYMTSWVIMVDPISYWIKGSPAGRFFLYGFIYTLAILVMGVRMLIKYRHSNYHIVRTISVMFFQTAFAFLIPEILLRLNKPYFDFKNIWPLDYDFFFENELNTLIDSGTLGLFMLFWGILLIIVAVPVLVYFFGKRWYCSWVCGCGGLAETLGDPYRQLSDKSLNAWKIERWMVHAVLVFAVLMTATVLYTYFTGSAVVLGVNSYSLRSVYGAWIGAGFAGVIGTGFYPLMGNRVWCRFGCPLAAYLGLVQRFKSRFRITTNGGQCISCGNCSTYCEMGIDVRWYAQRGQNIVRASCVGCGVCASVCPRGVLKLENSDPKTRFNDPLTINAEGIKLNS